MIIKNSIGRKFFFNKKIKKNLFKTFTNEIILNKNKNIFKYYNKEYTYLLKKYNLNNYKRFKKVVLIGMGGSILGSKSIYNFLHRKIKKEFFFFDNLDNKKISNFLRQKKLEKFLFIIVSKSGNTLETLSMTNLLKRCLSKKNTIIITENKNNNLSDFAKRNNFLRINHDRTIGGRYSVFSEVGMVPAYFMGLNLNNFRKKIYKHISLRPSNPLKKYFPIINGIYFKKKIKSLIFLNYCPELNQFLFWCQQLLAESLGKKGFGILPVVSPAPRDHHSLLQLYLDGPKDKIFYIFSSKNRKENVLKKNLFKKEFDFLKGKSLSHIINSQKEAMKRVLKNKDLPFREFQINEFDEESLGELFSYFILETWMIGKSLEINPFNQREVEEVKILTKKLI